MKQKQIDVNDDDYTIVNNLVLDFYFIIKLFDFELEKYKENSNIF